MLKYFPLLLLFLLKCTLGSKVNFENKSPNIKNFLGVILYCLNTFPAIAISAEMHIRVKGQFQKQVTKDQEFWLCNLVMFKYFPRYCFFLLKCTLGWKVNFKSKWPKIKNFGRFWLLQLKSQPKHAQEENMNMGQTLTWFILRCACNERGYRLKVKGFEVIRMGERVSDKAGGEKERIKIQQEYQLYTERIDRYKHTCI